MDNIVSNYHELRIVLMENLLNLLREISDLEWQQKVWVEASIPNVVSSWEEIMCQFFDDANIDYFLENLDPKYGWTDNQTSQMWKFRNLLNQYSDDTPARMDPRKVLADPDWHAVAACASETLKAFEGYAVPFDSTEVNRPIPR